MKVESDGERRTSPNQSSSITSNRFFKMPTALRRQANGLFAPPAPSSRAAAFFGRRSGVGTGLSAVKTPKLPPLAQRMASQPALIPPLPQEIQRRLAVSSPRATTPEAAGAAPMQPASIESAPLAATVPLPPRAPSAPGVEERPLDESPFRAYTVVLDLDETLCSNRRPGHALLRPFAHDLLRSLNALSNEKRYVEVILWTASMEFVAKPVVERLDASGVYFQHIIYRDPRWYREINFAKDLRRLGRDLKSTVIVENCPVATHLQPKNAIIVQDYVGGNTDTELKSVASILTDWITSGAENAAEYLSSHPMLNPYNHQVKKMPKLPPAAATSRSAVTASKFVNSPYVKQSSCASTSVRGTSRSQGVPMSCVVRLRA